MYTMQLSCIIKCEPKLKQFVKGVYACDELPSTVVYPSAFIINSHPKSTSGQHWLCIVFNKDKSAYYFDSFGNNPLFYNKH